MKPEQLTVGKVYFMCGSDNPGKPIPNLQALVYLGKRKLKGESESYEYLFQHPQMYFIEDVTDEDVKQQILNALENSGRVGVHQDLIDTVKSFDELLQWLTSLRHADGADELY